MKAWLLTANPEKQGFGKITSRDDLTAYQQIIAGWDNWTVKAKNISPGDSIYVMMLGQGRMNGIIAYGKAVSKPYTTSSWSDPMDVRTHVKIEYVSWGIFIPKETLATKFPDQCFSPQSSGISIRAKYAGELEALCRNE